MSEPSAPAAVLAPAIDATTALAAIASAEKTLAQHRITPLEALAAKVKAANLGDIAADIQKLLPLFTKDQDKALFDNASRVLGDVERLVTTATEANAKLAAA